MSCGQGHLLAQTLLLLFGMGQEQPTARGEIARDAFPDDDVPNALAVVERQRQHHRSLTFGLGLENLNRQARVAAAQKHQALVRHALVEPDRVLRDRLESTGIPAAGLTRRIAAVDHRHAATPVLCGWCQMIGGRGPDKSGADDQDVDLRGHLRASGIPPKDARGAASMACRRLACRSASEWPRPGRANKASNSLRARGEKSQVASIFCRTLV